MGKLPGWAKTKLAAEDNAGQVILVSENPNSIFWSFLISLPDISFPSEQRAGREVPLGRTGRVPPVPGAPCAKLPAHTIDIVNNQKRVFSNLFKEIEVCCVKLVSLAAA